MAAAAYLPRTLETALARAIREFPAVVLTGPRLSGKTTLLRHALGDSYHYVSLDLPDVEAVARNDPRPFLASHPAPVIFDELQHAPEILPYLRALIDERRGETGRYVLSGSQNLLMIERVTESLAGRAAWLTLWPLSRRETDGTPGLGFPWETGRGEPTRGGPGYVVHPGTVSLPLGECDTAIPYREL